MENLVYVLDQFILKCVTTLSLSINEMQYLGCDLGICDTILPQIPQLVETRAI